MVEFTPELTTYVPAIDDQHRELIKRLNALLALGARAANDEETEKTLGFLGAYVQQHFHDEESLQIKAGYPKYEEHRGQHQAFLAEFGDLVKAYKAEGSSIDLTLHINRSVISWVVRHIQSSDADLARYIRKNNLSDITV